MNQRETASLTLTSAEAQRLLEFLQEATDKVMDEHLTEEEMISYAEESCTDAAVKRIDRHLASCETCAIRMERRLSVPKPLLTVRGDGSARTGSQIASPSPRVHPVQLATSRPVAQAALALEPLSFEYFLATIEPKAKRLLAMYRIPSEDAEDVLQQALLALLYQWERVRDPESWLFGTVKRHCLMYWRKHRRQIYSAVDATILEWLSAPVAPSQDLLSDLESLIDRLPSRCRSLLRLRFRLGYEPLEVAHKLGYRASSIGKITTRCLAALSRELLASGLVEELPRPTETRRVR